MSKDKIAIAVIISVLLLGIVACGSFWLGQSKGLELSGIVPSEEPVVTVAPQSNEYFKGPDEIKPLFAGYETVGDYIKNLTADTYSIEYGQNWVDGSYLVQICQSPDVEATSWAVFVVEQNKNQKEGTFKKGNIPDSILNMKVKEVNTFWFGAMNFDFNFRGITKGADAADVTKAFMNKTGISIKDVKDANNQVFLYYVKDVFPNINFVLEQGEEEYDYYSYNSGRMINWDHIMTYPFRDMPKYTIEYNYTDLYGDNKISFDIVYSVSTSIEFDIDENYKVVDFYYHSWPGAE